GLTEGGAFVARPVAPSKRSCALLAAIAAAVFLIGGGLAQAGPIFGTGPFGDFTGSIGVSGQTATSATITIQLTNTTPVAIGNLITGLAFNNPGTAAGGNFTGVAGTSFTNANFVLIGGPSFNNSVPVNPFGDADIGAALGGDWEGGGNPNVGIAP